jgi:hypothetical protein
MAQIDLTLTNQDIDQDYADRKRRELDAEWAQYVQAGQAEMAAEATPKAEPAPAAEQPSALTTGLMTAIETAKTGFSNMVQGLGKVAVPLEGADQGRMQGMRQALIEGALQAALAPIVGAAAVGGQGLENLAPEIANAEFLKDGYTVRHLMSGAPAPAAMTKEQVTAMQGPMTVREAIETALQFGIPLGVKPAVKGAQRAGKAVKAQAGNLASERGSLGGPQPPPEGAKSSVAGPQATPEAMALREQPGAAGGAGKPPGGAPPPTPGAGPGPYVGEARINVDRLQATESVKGTAAAINALQSERLAGGRKTRTHTELQRKAQDLGLTVERAIEIDPATIPLGEAEVYQQAFRDLNTAASAHVSALADQVLAGNVTAQASLFDAFTVAGELSIRQEEFGRAFARGTEARRIMAEEGRAVYDPAALADLRERLAGEYEGDATLLAARLKSLPSTGPQRASFARQTLNAARLGINLVHTVWINFLLSNPQTHIANMAGTFLMQLYEIPERAAAGLIGGASRGVAILRGQTPAEHVRIAEASAAIRATAEGLRDGIRLAGMALTEAETPSVKMSPAMKASAEQLLQRTQISDMKPMSAEAYGFDPTSNFGRAVDALGSVGHRVAPTRLLGAEDAIFKGVAFRVELKSLAVREAMAQGLKGEDFARKVAELENEPPAAMMKQAVDGAFLRTLNNDLGPMGQAITTGINESVVGRFIIPFVRTPTNAAKYAWQRAPVLNMLSAQNWKDVIAGGAARDRALARVALGNAVAAVIFYETAQGNFIGEGPTDPRLRRDFFAAPADNPTVPRRIRNSVKIGGEYIGLDRLDPVLGSMISVTVNAAEIIAQLPQPPPGADEELDQGLQLMAAVGIAASRVFVNKSSMKGLADMLDAFAQPNRSGERVLKSFARSTVPGVVRQVQTRLVDENAVRDARSIVSQVKSGIPGYASDVPPRVQRITGQPVYYPPGWGPDMVSPVAYGAEAADPVLDELIRNRVAISDWPDHLGGQPQSMGAVQAPTRTPGVRLNLGQIHRLATITTAEVTINGMTQYDYLKNLVASPTYQQQSDRPGGGKDVMLRSAIRNFLDLGTQALRREDKELDDQLKVQAGTTAIKRMPITSPLSPQNPGNAGRSADDLARSLVR